MNKLIRIISFCLPIAGAIGATYDYDGDSTRTYRADEVVVTATRSAIQSADASSPLEVANLEIIHQINSSTVADVFRTFNGIHLMDYGPTGGMKSTMFRGLTSANVLVLLNGSPINEPLFGGVDLSLLPLSLVDRIEFVAGGGSALYGSSATGGVVNIITREASNELHAKLSGELGSFSAVRSSAEVEGRYSGVGIIVGLSKESGEDDYPFLFHRTNTADTTLHRSNGDYDRLQIYCNTDYTPIDILNVTSSFQYVKFSRGVPGSVTTVASMSVEQQMDEVSRFTLSGKLQITSTLLLSLNTIFNQTNRFDKDMMKGSDILYRMKMGSLNAQVQWAILESDNIIDHVLSGIEYGENFLDQIGISYGFPIMIFPYRNQKSLYLSNECTYQITQDWFDRVLLFQSLRYDKYSDVREDAFSPKLGINLRIYRSLDIRIRSTWSQNFRVPSFSDLYYPGFSNPLLNPERSTTLDVGIVSNLDWSGSQTLQFTFFSIETKEKIVFGSDWLPHNIGRTEHRGVEVRYDYHPLDNQYDVYAGFSFIEAKKKDRVSISDSTYNTWLLYVPNSTGTIGVSFETLIGRISIEESLIGIRYTDELNTISLPAYTLTNVRVTKKIPCSLFSLIIHVSVNNVFDTDYQVFTQYPMPGRTLRAGIGVEY